MYARQYFCILPPPSPATPVQYIVVTSVQQYTDTGQDDQEQSPADRQPAHIFDIIIVIILLLLFLFLIRSFRVKHTGPFALSIGRHRRHRRRSS